MVTNRTKKWQLSCLVAILLLALAPRAVPAHAAGAETSHSIFNHYVAFAFFESYDSSGCIGTFVNVFADDASAKFGPGQATEVSTLIMGISKFDFCTETSLLHAFLLVPVSADEFQIDKKLNSATLNTTLDVCCDSSGNSFPFPISVEWTGIGDTFPAKDHVHNKTPGFKENFKSVGTSRNAGASGSISYLGTNLIPAPDYNATLEWVKEGELEIIH